MELGYGTQRTARVSKKGERTPKGSRATKAEIGHAAKAGLEAAPAVLRSFRLDDAPGKDPVVPTYSVGDVIKCKYPKHGNRNILVNRQGSVVQVGIGPAGPYAKLEMVDGSARTLSENRMIDVKRLS